MRHAGRRPDQATNGTRCCTHGSYCTPRSAAPLALRPRLPPRTPAAVPAQAPAAVPPRVPELRPGALAPAAAAAAVAPRRCCLAWSALLWRCTHWRRSEYHCYHPQYPPEHKQPTCGSLPIGSLWRHVLHLSLLLYLSLLSYPSVHLLLLLGLGLQQRACPVPCTALTWSMARSCCVAGCSPDAQLDYLAGLRPRHVAREAWDEWVNEAVWAAAYFKSITST